MHGGSLRSWRRGRGQQAAASAEAQAARATNADRASTAVDVDRLRPAHVDGRSRSSRTSFGGSGASIDLGLRRRRQGHDVGERLRMDYLEGMVDASPLRAGKLMPGTHTPIVFPDASAGDPGLRVHHGVELRDASDPRKLVQGHLVHSAARPAVLLIPRRRFAVLVLGATGMLGRACVRRLRRLEPVLRVVARPAPAERRKRSKRGRASRHLRGSSTRPLV